MVRLRGIVRTSPSKLYGGGCPGGGLDTRLNLCGGVQGPVRCPTNQRSWIDLLHNQTPLCPQVTGAIHPRYLLAKPAEVMDSPMTSLVALRFVNMPIKTVRQCFFL